MNGDERPAGASKPSNEPASKHGRQLKFLLTRKADETLEEFKARVIQVARGTGMLKDKAT